MGEIINTIITKLDTIILATPVIACGTIGGVGRFAEESSNSVIKGLGWIGARSAIVLGIISGIPLIVYSLAKAALATGLNALTNARFQSLKDFENDSHMKLNVVLMAVSAIPLLIISAPYLIRTSKNTYDFYLKYRESICMVCKVGKEGYEKGQEILSTLSQLIKALEDQIKIAE